MLPDRRLFRRRWPRIVIGIVLAVPALAVAAIAAALLLVDPNQFKPQIVAAVKQATGRDLTLAGKISFTPSLWPTLAVRDVTLSNMPGGSRPDMLHVQRAQVRIALLPLLTGRFGIGRVELVAPDLLLETDATGRGNWSFAPAAPAPAPAAPSPAAPASGTPTAAPSVPPLDVQEVRIERGKLTWHNGQTGASRTVDIQAFDLREPSPNDLITFSGQVVVDGLAANFSGGTGSYERLQAKADGREPWPLRLTADAAGARLSVIGGVLHPLTLGGWSAMIHAQVPDLGQLSPLAGQPLPALHDVSLSGQFADNGTAVPDVSDGTFQLGHSDLAGVYPGLGVNRLQIAVSGMQTPIRGDGEVVLNGVPVALKAVLGTPAALSTPATPAVPWPFDLTAEVSQAHLSAKGTVQNPTALSGVVATVGAQIPDLPALSQLAGTPLPTLKAVTFSAQAADQGGLANGVALRDMALDSAPADLGGDLSVVFAPRLRVAGSLAAHHIDVAALAASAPAQAASAPGTGPAAPAPAEPRPARAYLIPDTPLPLASLSALDADLNLQVGELDLGQTQLRALAGHAVLSAGNLHLDPLTAEIAGGKTSLSLAVVQAGGQASEALTASAPALEAQAMAHLLKIPGAVSGTMKLDADLHGAGTSPHAIAAGLGGRLALSMSTGQISGETLNALLGQVVAAAKMPADLLGGGGATIRCLDVRMDAANGRVAVAALGLDTTKLALQGGGAINLADETLALRLRPLLRVGGPGIVVPVRVGGTLLAPKVGVDSGGTAESVAGLLGGIVAGQIGGAAGSAATGSQAGGACGGAAAASTNAPATGSSAAGTKTPAALGNLLKGFLK